MLRDSKDSEKLNYELNLFPCRFAVNARRSILSSFNRDFDSLKTKVFALFSETIESQKLAANKEAAKLEQQRYCSRLHEELEVF